MQSREILVSRFLQIVFYFLITGNVKAQVLYYTVKNATIEAVSQSFNQQNFNDEKGDNKFHTKTSSYQTKNDFYLIPFIVSEIQHNTKYKDIVFKVDSDLKKKQDEDDKLVISINVFNSFLEYQFAYYVCDKLKSASSFFINPDNPDYPNIITTEVQKIFKGERSKNKPPTSKIRLDKILIEKIDTVYKANSDTILLDASASTDDFTPKKYLTYRWEVRKNGSADVFLPDFNFERIEQKLVITDPGVYSFSLQVFDGVDSSQKNSVVINVNVLKKPALSLNNPVIEKYSQKHIINRDNERIFLQNYNIEYNISALDTNSRLILEYIHSENSEGRFSQNVLLKQKRNSLELKYGMNDTVRDHREKIDSIKFAGLLIDSIPFDSIGSIKFWYTKDLKPGRNKFLIYADYNKVKSNFDTVTVSYRQKSIVSVYAGYDRLSINKGKNYFNGYVLDVLHLGFRAYFYERFFADVKLMKKIDSYEDPETQNHEININAVMGQISFDLLPTIKKLSLQKRDNPAYLSPFISYYQFILPDSNNISSHAQWGIGGKGRVQILAGKPKLGIFYIEGEIGFYAEKFGYSYKSNQMSIHLIYGLWNY